jgi:hypothetical protein
VKVVFFSLMQKNYTMAGFQGWQQFLNERKKLLDQFDSAKIQASGHQVQTFHGDFAEALFRQWLESFLPKRFGVTSGYIIQAHNRDEKIGPHFDIIIYDAVNSPTLWIETTPDSSEQGKRRAIPVDYIFAVIEVKSRLTKAHAKDAIEHLKKLEPLELGIELATGERVEHLPSDFTCGVVFFETNENDLNTNTFDELLLNLRGFHGGIILRGNSQDSRETGRIELYRVKNEDFETIVKAFEDLPNHYRSRRYLPYGPDEGLSLGISFAPSNFSMYAFELIDRMQGKSRTWPYGMIYLK